VGGVAALQEALDTLAAQVGASLDMQRLQGIVWSY
jgi:hypothetical protein